MVTFLAAAPSFAAQASGLIAAYSFDEGSGASLIDRSGNGNNGTLSGPTWTTQGKFGGALSFDGVNDWVTVNDSISLHATGGLTIEAWVMPSAAQSGWRTIVQKQVDAYLLHAGNGSGALRPAAGGTISGANVFTSSPSAIAVGVWTHLAMTFDGSTIRLYVNGGQVATRTQAGTLEVNSNPLRLGGTSVYGEYFNGRIDEVRIYNRSLAASEIQADMAAPVGNPPADATPPTVSITAPASGAIVAGTINITANASDDIGVAGVQFQIDGQNFGAEDTVAPYSVSWNSSGVINGPHSLTAIAHDFAGNPAIAVVNVTVNSSGPVGTIVINAGAAATNLQNVTLMLSASDPTGAVTQMRFSNNGSSYSAAETYATTKTWALSSGAGTKTVYAQFKNAAGLWSLAFTDTIVLDTTAPTISGILATAITGSGATINWTTNETATSQVDYGLTTGYGQTTPLNGALLLSHVVPLTGLAPQTKYNFRVRSLDAAGNSRVSGNNTFTTTNAPDITPPTATVTSPAQLATVSGTITVSATASDNAGVAGVLFLLDGIGLGAEDTVAPYSVAWDTTTAANGPHTLAARARDLAGTTASSILVDVTVNNPPVLVILAPVEGQALNGTSVVDVSYTAIGDLTGVSHVHFKLDARSEVMDVDFDGAYQFTGVSAGPHLLSGYLVRSDHAKIPGTDDSVNFTTTVPDLLPPSISLTAPAGGATVTGTILLAADAQDDSGIAGVQFKIDGAAFGAEDISYPYSIPLNTTTLANGPHGVSAVARDLVNHLAASQSVSITVSNINPNDPAVIGSWSGPYDWPFVAIHLTLLHTGEVLGWDDHTENQGMYLWNPTANTFTTFPQSPSNLFCSGHTALPNGKTLICGGTGTTFDIGIRNTTIYDTTARTFLAMAPMKYARYYPTLIGLPDGTDLVVSGTDGCATCVQEFPEIYHPDTNTWTELTAARLNIPYYPHLFVLPDGRVLNTGSSELPLPTRALNLTTLSWATIDTAQDSGGSAAMYLPGKILRCGTSGNPNTTIQALATTQVIDMNLASPHWRLTAPMAFPRSHHNLTLLPDGTILVTGGGRSSNANDISEAVHEAELWSPATESWSTLAAMQIARLYHGTALLLPDGRVLEAGSGRPTGHGVDQFNAEIYSPPYLFKGPRPVIDAAPGLIPYASTFLVGTPDAGRIAKISLIRLSSVTHAFNEDQRFLELSYLPAAGGFNVQAPANARLAPPGYYLLFIIDTSGVPSIGVMVRLPGPGEDITAPAAPTGLVTTASIGTVGLTWTAATDNVGVVLYHIHRSTLSGFSPLFSNRIGQTASTSFTDSNIPASGTYYYIVTAEDAAQNIGGPSVEASADPIRDSVPPTVPLDVTAIPMSSGQISVSWSPSTDAVGVTGYRVFRNGLPAGDSPSSPFLDGGLTPSTSYTYTVAAFDAAGNVSDPSLPATAATPADLGPFAAYSFNEGNSTTLIDRSGKSNNGTLSGPTWTTQGKFGGALSFDGVNDWVTVNDSISLHATGGLTIEAWVMPSAAQSGWRTIVQKQVDAYLLHAGNGSGALRPAAGGTISGANVFTSSPSAIAVGVWTHLAMTFDGSTIRLYVNGGQVATRTQAGTLEVNSNPLRLGGTSVYGEYFNGRIDEVRLYNRALTAAQIQTDMVTPVVD